MQDRSPALRLKEGAAAATSDEEGQVLNTDSLIACVFVVCRYKRIYVHVCIVYFT